MNEAQRNELILPSGSRPDWSRLFRFVQMDRHQAFFRYERDHPKHETMEIDVMVGHYDRIYSSMTLGQICELKVTRLTENGSEANIYFENDQGQARR